MALILAISSVVLNVILLLVIRSRRNDTKQLQEENRRAWKYNAELQRRLERVAARRMVVSDLIILTRDNRPTQQITVHRN